jgi:hypothetical protein
MESAAARGDGEVRVMYLLQVADSEQRDVWFDQSSIGHRSTDSSELD